MPVVTASWGLSRSLELHLALLPGWQGLSYMGRPAGSWVGSGAAGTHTGVLSNGQGLDLATDSLFHGLSCLQGREVEMQFLSRLVGGGHFWRPSRRQRPVSLGGSSSPGTSTFLPSPPSWPLTSFTDDSDHNNVPTWFVKPQAGP